VAPAAALDRLVFLMFHESSVLNGSAGAPSPTVRESATGGRMSVLIVEDEALIAWDLRTLVEGFGWRVCGVAATGRDAVCMARETRPDLVLMDVRLRGEMDGVEAARLIRKSRRIGLIFVTGNSDRATEARIRAFHPTAPILSKPVVSAALRATMAEVVTALRAEGPN